MHAVPSAPPRPFRLHLGPTAGVAWMTLALLLAACGGDAPPGSADDDGAAAAAAGEGAVGEEGRRRGTVVTRVDAVELAPVSVPTDQLLIGISPASPEVTWLSGTGGRWLRTDDAGVTWVGGEVPGAGELQFRDVHGFDADGAVLLAAGEGDASRLFRTGDGGATWVETFVMDEPAGFLDCMDFWPDGRGLAYGDAVDGELYLLRTDDGGRSWSRVDPATLPAALEGEGGFAASGTCLETGPDGQARIATGNGTAPRLLSTDDYGVTWTVTELPLVGGSGSGATSVGFSRAGLGFAVGGSIAGEADGDRVALSADGGRSWSPGGAPAMDSPLYGAAWIPGSYALVAVGPGGVDWSDDGGMTWTPLDTTNHWSVAFADGETGWAVGPEGRVSRIRVIR